MLYQEGLSASEDELEVLQWVLKFHQRRIDMLEG